MVDCQIQGYIKSLKYEGTYKNAMVHFKYKGISRNSSVHFKYEGTSQKSYVGIDLKAHKDLKAWMNLNTMGILIPQKTHKEGAQTSEPMVA